MVSISPRTWTNAVGKTSRGFRLSYKDRDGKRRFKQFKRRIDAERFRDEELPKILSGALVSVSEHDWTMADAADHWLKACEKGRAGEEPLAAPTLDSTPGPSRVRLAIIGSPSSIDWFWRSFATGY